MKKLIFLFCLICFFGKNSFACSCQGQSFCLSYQYYQMAVSCVIVDIPEYGTRLKIIQTLHGSESRDTITVCDKGGPYDMCNDSLAVGNLYAHHLGSIGDTIVVALNKIDSATSFWHIVGDYVMPGFNGMCNSHCLRVRNGIVQGFVSGHNYCHYANNCVYSR